MNKSFMRNLTTKVHGLKPIVLIGAKGLTDAVNLEIDRALEDHELIKIRIQANDRNERNKMIESICQLHHAVVIKKIGHIVAIYRKRKDELFSH